MPAQHDIVAERELWDTFAASTFKDGAEPSFCWTQYAGHGPGPELLGDPRSVLEIGCGTGRALACLAQRGIEARGAGFASADARVLDAPHPGHIGTLLVRAVAP